MSQSRQGDRTSLGTSPDGSLVTATSEDTEFHTAHEIFYCHNLFMSTAVQLLLTDLKNASLFSFSKAI